MSEAEQPRKPLITLSTPSLPCDVYDCNRNEWVRMYPPAKPGDPPVIFYLGNPREIEAQRIWMRQHYKIRN
jgi:hypothetical protein